MAFDTFVYALAALVTYLSASVRCVDGWLLAGCKLMPHDLNYPCLWPHPLLVIYDAFAVLIGSVEGL
jgi:hypothetical protein